MSHIYKYTVDSFGFVPRLWQIWRDPVRGPMRCLNIERLDGKKRTAPQFMQHTLLSMGGRYPATSRAIAMAGVRFTARPPHPRSRRLRRARLRR